MDLFNRIEKNEKDDESIFIPFHHLAIFDRTYKATKNEEGVVCAILCFTVLEAFVNDLVGHYGLFSKTPVLLHEADHPTNNYLSEEEHSILDELKKLERKDVLTKFQVLGEWDNNEECCQNFNDLKRIRNNLVHLKAEEVKICNVSGELSGYPKFLNNFFQNKIISKPQKPTSWIELLENREFCLWCQETTYQVLLKATEMLPESNIKALFQENAYFHYSSELMRKRYAQTDRVT